VPVMQRHWCASMRCISRLLATSSVLTMIAEACSNPRTVYGSSPLNSNFIAGWCRNGCPGSCSYGCWPLNPWALRTCVTHVSTSTHLPAPPRHRIAKRRRLAITPWRRIKKASEEEKVKGFPRPPSARFHTTKKRRLKIRLRCHIESSEQEARKMPAAGPFVKRFRRTPSARFHMTKNRRLKIRLRCHIESSKQEARKRPAAGPCVRSKPNTNKKSQYKGVSWDEHAGAWVAKVYVRVKEGYAFCAIYVSDTFLYQWLFQWPFKQGTKPSHDSSYPSSSRIVPRRHSYVFFLCLRPSFAFQVCNTLQFISACPSGSPGCLPVTVHPARILFVGMQDYTHLNQSE
jgi:hypothetical protein